MNVGLWQLANDRDAYGDHAGWWIVVSTDGEDELSDAFKTEQQAKTYAEWKGWIVVEPDFADRVREFKDRNSDGHY